jgi:hypothetical protein
MRVWRQILLFALPLAGAMVLAEPAAAQGKGKWKQVQKVPPGHLPPAGMCRVWIDGVPPGRQPEPTDCRTAERQVWGSQGNARVIYGSRGYERYDGVYDRDGRSRRYDRYDGVYDRDDRRARRRDSDYCLDRDHDGRCDARRTRDYPVTVYPQTRRQGGGVVIDGRH